MQRNTITTLSIFLCFILPTFLAAQHAPRVTSSVVSTIGIDGTASIPASCFLVGEQCGVQEVLISSPQASPMSSPPADASSLYSYDCAQLGTNIVWIWIQDWLGEWSYRRSAVLLADPLEACNGGPGFGISPSLQAFNVLAYGLGENESATVHARDFVSAYSTPSNTTPTFSFSSDPADTLRVLGCNDVGFVQLEVHLLPIDPEEQAVFVDVFVSVSDAQAYCGNNTAAGTSFPAVYTVNIPFSYTGELVLKATDFLPCCAPDDLQYAFSPDPEDNIKMLDCDSLAAAGNSTAVTIFGISPDGSYTTSEVFYVLEDPLDYCGQNAGYTPPNDDACDAIPLQVGRLCAYRASNIGASAEMGEVVPTTGACNTPYTWCDGIGAEHSVWFQFEAPASGSVRIHSDFFNTQLALWETNSCDGLTNGDAVLIATLDDTTNTSAATMDSISCLIPGKTYYLQVDGHGGMMGTFEIRLEDLNLPCQLAVSEVNDCLPATAPPVSLAYNAWQHATDEEGSIIASIADGGQSLGNLSVTYQDYDGAIRADSAGQFYLDRNWQITSEHTAQNPIRLRLYFTAEEWDALQMVEPGINTPEDVFLTRVPMGTCGQLAGTTMLFEQLGSGLINEADYFIDFEIDGFSAFYLNGASPLTSAHSTQARDGQIKVFPNPSSGAPQVSIQLPNEAQVELRLLSSTGQILEQRVLYSPTGKQLLPVASAPLPQGIYILQVLSPNGKWSKRIIIQ